MKNKIYKQLKSLQRNLVDGTSPDFLIIGAQKSGTTSLHHYLQKFYKDPNRKLFDIIGKINW
ncbi:hypothetical protein [Methanosalsum natronophilum]|uniref:hypothetical protein n=1 Tax=Methanosalsum natronophilum TaxID=768733 RepID=UPI0021672A90|nr:hypothetical protein [Methanosalsum natronophilum]MCS3924892.1 hypothetical protein [Methanosalsum natronophilum]